MRMTLILTVLFLCDFADAQTLVYDNLYSAPYKSGELIIRLKSDQSQLAAGNSIRSSQLLTLLQEAGMSSIERKFPRAVPPPAARNKSGERYADISLIYLVKFENSFNPHKLIPRLMSTGILEYAELDFVPEVCYVPNDDSVSSQYNLEQIHAFEAWDIHKGDTSTIIGIVDTGHDPYHPDLGPNLAPNRADPVNGIDDDNDGFVDNYWGWNTALNNNNPFSAGNSHGQHVSGISSALADNGIGISGAGFYCRFVPIKAAAQGVLIGAYDGLVYGADQGYPVINCSWGSFQYSAYNEELVRYASINKNCLVVTGSGNNNSTDPFYPGAYPYALNVGATTLNDIKAAFSNYGYTVQLFAPGDRVLSTWENGGYLRSGGTSMSAPLVSGAAAILYSQRPLLNSRQLAAQLLSTADNIDNVPENTEFQNQLGYGRLNMFRALNETDQKFAKLVEIETRDKFGGRFLPGDTINISGILVNYLSPVTEIKILPLARTGNIQVLSSELTYGPFSGLESLQLNNGIRILIAENAPVNDKAVLALQITTDEVTRTQYLEFEIHSDLINLDNGLLKASFKSEGSVGAGGTTTYPGYRFRLAGGANLLSEGGLMLAPANAASPIIDNLRGIEGDNNDWKTTQVFGKSETSLPTTEMYVARFTSNLDEFPIDVIQRVISDSSAGNQNFFIVDYRFQPPFPAAQEVHASLLTDWDLGSAGHNVGSWENSNGISYIRPFENDTIYAGVKLLSNFPYHYHSLKIGPSYGDFLDISGGFSPELKYRALTELNTTAAPDSGADLMSLTGYKNIPLGDTAVRIAFAILAGKSLDELNAAADAAGEFYNSTNFTNAIAARQPEKLIIYPNPAGDFCNIILPDIPGSALTIELFDNTGRKCKTFIQTATNGLVSLNLNGLAPGFYTGTLNASGKSHSFKLLIAR